ncbi:MAG TPA: carbamoyltransferase C-terminal domain-containing protein [Cyclobacteriaceae bacterium]
MYTLGINAAFHDSSASIINDGQLLAAVEEERFTHVKHGKRPIPFSTYELPYHAIDYCLQTARIDLRDVDHIAYSFNPSLFRGYNKSLLDQLFISMIQDAPGHLADGFPHHLQKRFMNATKDSSQWHFVDHHIAHAASAFLPSPFEEAAVMTLDGRGERTTTSYYYGDRNNLGMLANVEMPHSLGLLYERITTYLGFLHSSDEYKVMALASYGEPTCARKLRSHIHLHGDGTYTIDDFDFAEVFGPIRHRGEPFVKRHYDIASSLQKVLEEIVLELSGWLQKKSSAENLCLAGGVALNCVLNAAIRDNNIFKDIWVQPAAGDAGTSLGAALWIDRQQSRGEKFTMSHAYWGPAYGDSEVEDFLKWTKVPYRKLNDIPAETAAILANNKVIGWYQGRMEFGPRALGSRSILASPIHADMQSKLNDIKDREDFRPVAPVVLEEDAGEWFDNAEFSPFMLFVYKVKDEKKDLIPAVRHVDGTARIQTINAQQHPQYYNLLKEFKKLTGVPVLVNTSFNTRGEPIVCTPRDAVECFWTSPLDALVIGSYLLEKQR